jgi:hypothetical protein
LGLRREATTEMARITAMMPREASVSILYAVWARSDPNEGPGHRFLEGDNAGLAVEDAEIERQHREDEEVETSP